MVLSRPGFAGLQGGMLYPKTTHIQPTCVVFVRTRRALFTTPGPRAIPAIPMLLHPALKPTLRSIPAEPPSSLGAARGLRLSLWGLPSGWALSLDAPAGCPP